jgi:hypothetical protein
MEREKRNVTFRTWPPRANDGVWGAAEYLARQSVLQGSACQRDQKGQDILPGRRRAKTWAVTTILVYEGNTLSGREYQIAQEKWSEKLASTDLALQASERQTALLCSTSTA